MFDNRKTPKKFPAEPHTSDEHTDLEIKLKRKVNFYKWAVGIVIAIFGAGFYVAERVGSFATKDSVSSSLEKRIVDHDKDHRKIDRQIEKLDRRSVSIMGEQRAASERQKLISVQIEYLVENMGQPQPRRKRRKMRAKIDKQAARVKEIEDDPLKGMAFD